MAVETMKKIVLLITIIAALASCKKKELVKPDEGTPEIWMSAKVNNVPMEFKAGVNATYATSVTDSISTNLREFVFKITSYQLNKSVQITLLDEYNSSTSMQTLLDSAILTGKYKFSHAISSPFKLNPNEITIIYTDEYKQEDYYTLWSAQDITTNFQIVSTKDIIRDGKPYKMAEINFSCKIYCPSNGWQLKITDGKAMIPFGSR